ncbi:MAG: DUF393 domain-containing protein [Flavobacterium sp.]|nr:MAG: DUF393 domain-containing protein [Flavobacterium sp.]
MDISTLPKDKQIILFDGVCNLCDSFVKYIIKRDKKDLFRFVSLQSETGKEIIRHIGVDASVDSVILYVPGVAYYTKSGAAIEIVKHLGWHFAAAFSLVPKLLRDLIYDYIARNRYKWYGRKDACLIPTDEILHKFL